MKSLKKKFFKKKRILYFFWQDLQNSVQKFFRINQSRDTHFFISHTFISNARLKLAKNQAKAEQQPEAEILLFENSSHTSSRHHPKIIGHVLKTKQKNMYVCIHEITRLIIMKMKIKMKNRSQRYDINRLRSTCDTNISKYKQHLKFNSWKSKATLRLCWNKSVAYKKRVFKL